MTNGGYLNGKAKTYVPEPNEAELSEFMAKVSGLLKWVKIQGILPSFCLVSFDELNIFWILLRLVDSRDIVELELKQLDCEIVIRKKEALQQAAPPAPVYHSMPPQMANLPMAPAQSVAPPPSPTPSSTPATAKPTTAPSPSHPPLKSPMAGTFYRSPGPGEPPFVKVTRGRNKKKPNKSLVLGWSRIKVLIVLYREIIEWKVITFEFNVGLFCVCTLQVGDKVQKGQVVCIIEAMKLMNEIEVWYSSL